MNIHFAPRIEGDDLAYALMVGGSPEAVDTALLKRLAARCEHIVAVDRGLDALIEANIPCDLFCGDADSVTSQGASLVEAACTGSCGFVRDVERYDPHKDLTDLALALRAAHERWGEVPLVFTSLDGGRTDHALAAIGRMLSWDGPVAWEEPSFSARLLRAGDAWGLSGHAGATFSFVCLSPEASVSEHGMEWLLDHRRVHLLEDLGISNVLHEEAVVECHEGSVMAFCLRSSR